MEFTSLVQHARTHADRRPVDAGRRLAQGQSPTVLFITCADSRIVPSAITGAEPGSLFELRTAGNVIPRFTPDSTCGELATIEFAVVQLAVSEIVVCGHSHCGAVRALHADDPLDHLPHLRRWLTEHLTPGERADDPALRAEGRRHVLTQLDALTRYPFVAERVASGAVRVHGWFYDIETGVVSTHEPQPTARAGSEGHRRPALEAAGFRPL
ncbi:carbonic anhydrase [Actinosynnema pretiosum]|uniref:Carbonic anhydrase n=2 Tax=Actinosynnema TaxID=40566 RepID=A0A290Z1S3_9PSEU|nr:carbonic anhydrase [Actinosynnema pretiosum]ATE52942.1 carbonic anhydrase [Actinosynnema pretiosum]